MMSDLIATEVSTKAQKALHASERKICATRCIPNKRGYCGSTDYADGYIWRAPDSFRATGFNYLRIVLVQTMRSKPSS